MKTNKFCYLHVVQGNYGYGWEDLTQSEHAPTAYANLKDYRANEQGPHRMIERRELMEQG